MTNSESAISSYQAARQSLIAEDRALRFDQHGKYTSILGPSDLVGRADCVLRNLRRYEQELVWSKDIGDENTFPGMAFLTAKETIQKTKLFRWMKALPKGALLHSHMDAMCDAEFLIKEAFKHKQMHVQASRPVTAETLAKTLPSFSALPANAEGLSIVTVSSPDYKAGEWVQVARAKAEFPFDLGGPDGFDRWALGALRIDPHEAYVQYKTANKIWEKFGSTFLVARGLIGFEPVLAAYMRELLLSSIEDGISYIETRLLFFEKYMVRANGQRDFTHREWCQLFAKTVEDVRQEMKTQAREDEFVGAKVIYTTLRFVTIEEIDEYFDDCIALKKEFPDLIAGFDLVGQEDTNYPLLYYLPKLLTFQERVKAEGLSIPFVFHAGETLGDGDKVDDNVYDAVLLKTKRIGHGFSLVKHPHLMTLCRERGITIEVCPISNEILRLTSSMPMHPLPILLNNGVPIALSCDDPSVFGNLGLSYDFFQVMVASEITGLVTLGIIARESLLASCLNEDDKAAAVAKWDRQWLKFLNQVIQSEGSDPESGV